VKAPPPPTLHLGSAEQCCLVSSGGGCGGKAVDRREGERQRMSRTQRRIRHVTEAASLRIGAGLGCQAPNADCV
jgi:hypothetical protein